MTECEIDEKKRRMFIYFMAVKSYWYCYDIKTAYTCRVHERKKQRNKGNKKH